MKPSVKLKCGYSMQHYLLAVDDVIGELPKLCVKIRPDS